MEMLKKTRRHGILQIIIYFDTGIDEIAEFFELTLTKRIGLNAKRISELTHDAMVRLHLWIVLQWRLVLAICGECRHEVC